MGWLQSPILFYPLVLIGSILVTAWQLGLMPILMSVGMPVIRTTVNGALSKTPIPFRI
jgi:hypothetical protein